MTNNLWNITLDDGVLGNLTPPDEIVAVQCKHLDKITGGKIIAKISPCRGHDEYETPDNMFEFEFYLTSTFTPNYRYSVMFMNHKIEYYPLTLQVDIDIAKEIGKYSGYQIGLSQITAKNEEDFIATLSRIINSAKVKKVINSLYSMIKSHERKKDIDFGGCADDVPF